VIKEFQHPAIQTKNRAAFWQIFSSNKSAPANKRHDSMQTVIRTSRRLDSFLHEVV
jgi:hypothetical protein